MKNELNFRRRHGNKLAKNNQYLRLIDEEIDSTVFFSPLQNNYNENY